MNKGTISISFVAEALAEAKRRGLDVAALTARAGFSAELLGMPLARVSPQQYGALWHVLAAALGDEFFGMDAHPMRPGGFAILTHAVLDARDLHHALERALRFFSLVLDDVSGQLNVHGGQAALTLIDRGPPARLFAHGTLFVILHGLACWLVGRRLPIVATSFCQPAPEHAAEYRLIFGQALRFEQPASRLVLDAAHLDLPLVRDRKAAQAFLREAPANFLLKYRCRNGPTALVRGHLCRVPPADWPDFEVLAASLHTTASTLRRHLEQEGQTYQSIKDDLRRDLAVDYLCNSPSSVADIAHALGFAEHSAFHRAFRKWTGASPGEYRHQGAASAARAYAGRALHSS